MADLTALAQAIAAADKQIAAENPYSRFSNVTSGVDDLITQSAGTGKHDLGELIALALGSGLVGGLTSAAGDDYASKKHDLLTSALDSGLETGKFERPEGLSSAIFAPVQNVGTLFTKEREVESKAERSKALNEILAKRGVIDTGDGYKKIFDPLKDIEDEARAKKLGDVRGEVDAYGVTGEKNPSSPMYKTEQDSEKALSDLRGEVESKQSVKEFAIADKGFRSLLRAIEDPTGTSDVEIIRGAIQAIEPGLAVRTDDQTAVQESASLSGAMKAKILRALEGGSGLDPEVREGLVRIAKRRYDEQARMVNEIFDTAESERSRRKLPAGAISFLSRPSGADELEKTIRPKARDEYSGLRTNPTEAVAPVGLSELESSINDLVQQAKDPKLSAADKQALAARREKLLNAARSLTPQGQASGSNS